MTDHPPSDEAERVRNKEVRFDRVRAIAAELTTLDLGGLCAESRFRR
jgi:hypothetical protein